MHQLLKGTFNFPEYHGRNWDAFWDILYDYIDRNIIIEIVGLDSLPYELKQDSKTVLKIFKRITNKYPGVSILTK
jgi:Barstar, RNAse (barnase) inhibitor